jgi:hypothetical protein
MAIHLGHRLLHGSSDSSRGRERAARGPKTSPSFDLAPGGVYRPPMSPLEVRELLPHAFTLTSHIETQFERRFAFCGTVPGVTPAGR